MDFDGRRPLQNIPVHMLWVRQTSLVVRDLGTDLRAELGTYDELIATDGLFAGLHRLQSV
ncbi:hypothetical protein AB0H83_16870 [Dactylosporangium sp. NPDC050688]|uniref:hypothetical protein n=1 Tax=Dactylosporangium sp. NPDC050688 TaxID=3157217 RepID=UPI00340D8829